MTSHQTQATMELFSGREDIDSTEMRSKEPSIEEDQSCDAINSLLRTFSLDDSTSLVAEATLDTSTKSMKVTLSNWNVVLVGQSSTKQLGCNCPLHDKENTQHKCCYEEDWLQADSGPKEEECNDQENPTAEVDYNLQPFNETQECKQLPTSGEIVVDVEPLIPLIKTTGYLNGAQCERIMGNLEGLQDNGHFEKHDRLVASYIKHSANGGNTDMELALKIERGVAFSYQKKFKQSRRLFTSVLNCDTLSKLRNPNLLLARGYCRLVQDYRYRRSTKFSALFRCLKQSEFLLQNHESPADWAEVYYNYGSLWLAYMSMIPDDERNKEARNDVRRKAKYYFEMTIESCKKDPRQRVQVNKQIYGHLRVATLLLDCTSTVARTQQKVIPPQDIADAIKHLDILEHQLADNIPRGTRVQILKTRSDQYYRQGTEMYQLAKKTAQDALSIAECHGFNTELDSLQERIDFLNQLCEDESCKERIRLLVDYDILNSDPDASGETSYNETERKSELC